MAHGFQRRRRSDHTATAAVSGGPGPVLQKAKARQGKAGKAGKQQAASKQAGRHRKPGGAAGRPHPGRVEGGGAPSRAAASCSHRSQHPPITAKTRAPAWD